ncbi:RNA polymerase sigma factor [Bosea sp. (in: a-proteobacteria)]|uniref:RNA polymerase sigma factor n=1 Tax=Bosea sp. (in: a-proteobacteria) TaxID=1871050 RepID=UPI003F709632
MLRFAFRMTDIASPPLSRLFESHYGELRAFALRKLNDIAAADDVVQEACLRLAGLDGQAIENPRAFLYRVVGNLIIDHTRRERVRSRYHDADRDGLEVRDERADAERQLLARQRLRLVTQAIAELPPKCRECFVLRRFEELDQSEIAERMGISRNMVEKHLRHAVTHCARRLRDGD